MRSLDPRTLALGLEIRAEAAARRMTIADLATRAGVSRASLYNWLDGKVAMPITGFMAVASALAIPPHELIRRAEERARRDGQAGDQ